MQVILNRGLRTWSLRDGKDSKGNPVKRTLPPGGSIEALDQAEADQLLAHHRELVDASKAVPQVTDRIKVLEDKVADLESQIATYKERLAKYEPATTEKSEVQEKKGSKK